MQVTENYSHGDLVGLLPSIGHTLACGKLFIIRMAQDPGGEGKLRMRVVTSHSPKLRVGCFAQELLPRTRMKEPSHGFLDVTLSLTPLS